MGCSEFESAIYFHRTYPLCLAWLFEIAGGAIVDFEDNSVPKSQREAAFTIAALHQWEMDIDDTRCVESAEEVTVLGLISLDHWYSWFV